VVLSSRRDATAQPPIARLEAVAHEPSLATLRRLAQVLGLRFHIAIIPDRIERTA